MFIDDYPISRLDDDKLNRRKFAESLGQAILNYDNEHCLTVSLMGKWGSGKTSIINMVKDYWELSENKNIIVHFDPWYFSNSNNLLFQFFEILSKLPEDDFSVNTDNLKKLGKSLINMTSISFNLIAATININPEVNNTLSDQETLLSLKDEISNDFKKLDKKVIIIIDNIDRLSDNEVQQILMLVKSLGNFPKVVYILSFDKDAVVDSLNNLNVHAPEMFLEKIIQIPIVVPKIRKTQLDDLVESHLGDFYNNYHDDENYQKDFFDIYTYLRLFFNNLRDLYRYINVITFYFSVFKDDVNINDFMLILAMQLFEHEIYNRIKDNQSLFLVSYENLNDELKEYNKNRIQEIIKLHSRLPEEDIYRILLKLFPKIRIYYGDKDLESSYTQEESDFRICTANHFDNYFTLALDIDNISVTSINDLFKLNNVEKISATFLEYDKNNQTKELFDMIIDHMKDIPEETAHYFINSLIDIGDQLNGPLNGIFDKKVYLSGILVDLLKKYDNNSKRFNVLKKAIDNSKNSLYVAVDFLSDHDLIFGEHNNGNKRDISKALIDKKDLEKLENLMVVKIRNWYETGKLWDCPDLDRILYNWEVWDKENDVKKQVSKFIFEGKNALRFAKRFRKINNNAYPHSYITKNFNLKSMLKYFEDIESLRRKYVEIYKNESLNDEEQEICESLLINIGKEYDIKYYKTGNKVDIGTYFCTNCNQKIIREEPMYMLPPCPNCNGVEFVKL